MRGSFVKGEFLACLDLGFEVERRGFGIVRVSLRSDRKSVKARLVFRGRMGGSFVKGEVLACLDLGFEVERRSFGIVRVSLMSDKKSVNAGLVMRGSGSYWFLRIVKRV